MNRSYLAVPCALFLGLAACTETPHAETPDELAAKQRNERMDQNADQKQDRIELGADQKKDTVDARADAQKDRVNEGADAKKDQIDKQADRSKFDAEIKARLDKVDVRLADANGKLPNAKAASRPRANEVMKTAKTDRASLGDSYVKLSTVTDAYWEPTKTQIETSMKTLEGEVSELETLVAS